MSYVGVQINGLVKSFDDGEKSFIAVNNIDLTVERGEFLVLLGPSGCGKTTTLRCLAGLESPEAGQIAFGDRVVFDSTRHLSVAPDKRRIGMVFQSYALWPNMSVRKNIAFPLKATGAPRSEIAERVEEAARLVDCEPLLDRLPSQLSGGQQQRVALARALVGRPEVILFDEPLSNLDARLRQSIRSEIHQLHGRLGFTAVFVTHDQSEALALGDRLVVMRSGTLEQVDAPEAMYDRPASEYVADFIGMSNRLELTRSGEGWFSDGVRAVGTLPVPSGTDLVTLRFRPEDVEVLDGEAASASWTASERGVVLPAKVIDAQFGGRHLDVTAHVGAAQVHVQAPLRGPHGTDRRVSLGDEIGLLIPHDAGRFFHSDGSRVDETGGAS